MPRHGRASTRGGVLGASTRTMRGPATSDVDESAPHPNAERQRDRQTDREDYEVRLLSELSADVKLFPGLAIGPRVKPSALSSCSTRLTISPVMPSAASLGA